MEKRSKGRFFVFGFAAEEILTERKKLYAIAATLGAMLLATPGFAQKSLSPAEGIAILTSPEFDGRDAPGSTADKTADWIVEQLAGLAGDCKIDTQTVPLQSATLASQFSLLSLSSSTKMFLAKWGDRFYIFPRKLHSVDLNVNVQFCGYGLSLPDSQRNDYPEVVRGKAALVLAGSDIPAGMRASAAFKAAAAERAGVTALIVVYNDSLWPPEELDAKIRAAGNPIIDFPESKKEIPVAYIYMPGITDEEIGTYTDLKLRVNFNRPKETPSRNVLMTRPGKLDEWIVVGAHYDHLGKGFPGADDNASGVVGLLELARRFAGKDDLNRGIIFVWFTAEEDGLLGSQWFAGHLPVEREKIVSMINLDMIGRNGYPSMREAAHRKKPSEEPQREYAAAYFSAGSPELRDIIRPASDNSSLEVSFQPVNSFRHFGDAAPFHEAQIPTLHVFSGFHSDYHKPTDTPDKIDFDKLEDMIGFSGDLINNLLNTPVRPIFDPSIKVESTGMGY